MAISPRGVDPRDAQHAERTPIDPSAFSAPPRCAGCGVRLGASCQPRLPYVYFCDECWALSSPPEFDEELGAGD